MKLFTTYPIILGFILLSFTACKKQITEKPEGSNSTDSGIVESAKSRCLLSPDPGRCRAAFTRYYYSPKTKKCESFIWGGCDGVVPFETLEDCKICMKDQGGIKE